MLEKDFSISKQLKATLISVVSPNLPYHQDSDQVNRSLVELKELLRTLEIPVGSQHIQVKKSVDPASIIGSGKLMEIADIAREEGSKILIFDCELTASQIRNIKDLTKLPVIDRCQVILEIFAQHARTKEAKIQIEISRLQYLLPRLTGLWTHLGRQKGGVGVRGGEGEQQIELDRRIIRERIQFFKEELKTIIKSRMQQGKKRKNKAITAALVGYTNAGKSSIMNRLCRVNVLEENKLFATLDSTYRMLNPDTKPPMVLIDTVGFISNLPATLIEGFKTTLESAIEADLLIIVCDISDPNYKTQLEVTEKVLKDLEIFDKEKIIVFNKKDLQHDDLKKKIILRTYPKSFLVSSYDDKDITNLRKFIINFFLEKQENFDLFIPYENGEAHAKVSKNTNIIKSFNHERGIFYRIRVPDFIFDGLGLEKFILSPKDELYKSISL
jgi:GTP-binding protein HflX